jgi:general secretion pathway protein G
MLRLLKDKKGMTLLEIMIVLAILAGLIAVLATQVQGRLKKARINEAKIQIGELGKALDMYYTDCGSYPTPDQGLHALIEAPTSCTNWGPDAYVKKLAKDPWGHEFAYDSNGSSYTIKSFGSDGKEGGTGDAADISSQDQ